MAQQAGQEGLPLLVGTVLDALFSEAVRRRVQQEAEEGLEELLDATIESLPDSGRGAGLEQELIRTERQLRILSREAIDSLFTGSVRAEFQQHMEDAVGELMKTNGEAAKQHAQLAGESLLSGILEVLRRHWAQVLRLLLAVVARALEEALASHVKEAFAAIAVQPAEAIEEKTEPIRDQLEGKAEELRERLEEARDTLQDRLEEAKEEMQERIGQGSPSASRGGTGGRSQLGRLPSRRPPSGPASRRTPGSDRRRTPSGGPPGRRSA